MADLVLLDEVAGQFIILDKTLPFIVDNLEVGQITEFKLEVLKQILVVDGHWIF
jgi:hypothetical protein